MKTFTTDYAAQHLDELIDLALQGQVILLSLNGDPVARLVPIDDESERRGAAVGGRRGLLWRLMPPRVHRLRAGFGGAEVELSVAAQPSQYCAVSTVMRVEWIVATYGNALSSATCLCCTLNGLAAPERLPLTRTI